MSNIPFGTKIKTGAPLGLGGRKQSELGFHVGAFRRRGTERLVGNAEAPCPQGGNLFVAGLVAEGIAIQG